MTNEITETPCPMCGALVAGLNGNYSCTRCEQWQTPSQPAEQPADTGSGKAGTR